MKKQFIFSLLALLLASCAYTGEGQDEYRTLADVFVWGDDEVDAYEYVEKNTEFVDENTPDEKRRQYIVPEEDNITYREYKYNDTVDVKYVDAEDVVAENMHDEADNIMIKEVVVETEDGNENAQTYTLTKRSERYKKVEDTFNPNVYAVLASRVTNKFLTDMPAYFANKENPALYIEKTEYGDRFLPATPDVAENTAKEIILGSNMIKVVDDKALATHVLKGRISNINTPEVPVFKYGIALYEKDNKLVEEWSDTIRQVQNDDGSWW